MKTPILIFFDIDETLFVGFGIENVAVCQELFDEIVEVVKLLFVKSCTDFRGKRATNVSHNFCVEGSVLEQFVV